MKSCQYLTERKLANNSLPLALCSLPLAHHFIGFTNKIARRY
jgi:hypothetical protein